MPKGEKTKDTIFHFFISSFGRLLFLQRSLMVLMEARTVRFVSDSNLDFFSLFAQWTGMVE